MGRRVSAIGGERAAWGHCERVSELLTHAVIKSVTVVGATELKCRRDRECGRRVKGFRTPQLMCTTRSKGRCSCSEELNRSEGGSAGRERGKWW